MHRFLIQLPKKEKGYAKGSFTPKKGMYSGDSLWELSQGRIIGRPHLLIHLETYHYVTYQLPCLNGLKEELLVTDSAPCSIKLKENIAGIVQESS